TTRPVGGSFIYVLAMMFGQHLVQTLLLADFNSVQAVDRTGVCVGGTLSSQFGCHVSARAIPCADQTYAVMLVDMNWCSDG
ncbi:MAG TPA: hypothetical protein VMX97_16880, partial [Hyphomicrobiaceae bacterium]|nr:hypothetical protein [Hyphomicrobiaceae bacterium]